MNVTGAGLCLGAVDHIRTVGVDKMKVDQSKCIICVLRLNLKDEVDNWTFVMCSTLVS